MRTGQTAIRYSGLDLSEKYLSLSHAKYPDTQYYLLDILNQPEGLPSFDYIVINGVSRLRLATAMTRCWPTSQKWSPQFMPRLDERSHSM